PTGTVIRPRGRNGGHRGHGFDGGDCMLDGGLCRWSGSQPTLNRVPPERLTRSRLNARKMARVIPRKLAQPPEIAPPVTSCSTDAQAAAWRNMLVRLAQTLTSPRAL